MSSPEVWEDAWRVLQGVAAQQNVPLQDAGSQMTADQRGPYLFVESSAGTSDRIELGTRLNAEYGTVWVHVMIPSGYGTIPALTVRKAVSVAFRLNPTQQAGLNYHDQTFMPPDVDDTGNWIDYQIGLNYVFQDITTVE